MDGVAEVLTSLPPGWAGRAMLHARSGLEAGAKCAEGAEGESIVSLQARCIPAGPSQGAEVEDWDLESLDLCRQHVQALGDAVRSAKMSRRRRRNPPGQALGRQTPPNSDAPFVTVVEEEACL